VQVWNFVPILTVLDIIPVLNTPVLTDIDIVLELAIVVVLTVPAVRDRSGPSIRFIRMQKLRYHRPGTAPATLAVPPEHAGCPTTVRLTRYDAHSYDERNIIQVSELEQLIDPDKVNWINIYGLGDLDTLREIGHQFRVHPLALEDILNIGQRPKVDEYDGYLFFVLQVAYENASEELVFEQVSLVLGSNFVITIQEDEKDDPFTAIHQRLRDAGGNLRFMKGDYLAYALIDTVIDHYFPIAESISEGIEDLEENLLGKPTNEKLREIHSLRRALLHLRRFIWPTRDLLGKLNHDETGLIAERTHPFLRDCYDHTISLMDILENYREAISNITELYLSSLSMRTNEIMRVLTVITSVFIPLTFIVGVYGMNFDNAKSPFNMPELHWRYGYPAVILLMLGIAIGMILFFKRKKWL
jgi:magnesium transporter